MRGDRKVPGVRPRTVAVGFLVYVFVIAFSAGIFAESTATPWFPPDLSRWVYISYLACAIVFFAGLVIVGRSLSRDFEERLRRTGRAAEAPPEPPGDRAEGDMEGLLAGTGEDRGGPEQDVSRLSDTEIRERRLRILEDHRRRIRLLTGPAAANLAVVLIILPLIPAVDGMLQRIYALNTALILGIGYDWLGLGFYVLVSIALAVSSPVEDSE